MLNIALIMKKINFHVISIFPSSLDSYLQTSILKRALERKIIKVNILNPRDFTADKHQKVDDSPYGGGPGMVLMIGPILKAVQSIKSKIKKNKGVKNRTILFSTRGKKFTGKDSLRLAKYDNLILICGRYEGVDERVAEHIADEEISIGDYILSGGELPAMVIIDSISRQIPGVLGKQDSLEEHKGSYPVFTKPETFPISKTKKLSVPKILLSGNHKQIQEWRSKYNNQV